MASETEDAQSIVEECYAEMIDIIRGTTVNYRQNGVEYEINVDFGFHEVRQQVNAQGIVQASIVVQDFVINTRYFAFTNTAGVANPIPNLPQQTDQIRHVVNGQTKVYGLSKSDNGRFFVRQGRAEKTFRVTTILESIG